MDARNLLFNKAMEILLEEGLDEGTASQKVRSELSNERAKAKARCDEIGKNNSKRTKANASGGQDVYTRPVDMMKDLCEGNLVAHVWS